MPKLGLGLEPKIRVGFRARIRVGFRAKRVRVKFRGSNQDRDKNKFLPESGLGLGPILGLGWV